MQGGHWTPQHSRITALPLSLPQLVPDSCSFRDGSVSPLKLRSKLSRISVEKIESDGNVVWICHFHRKRFTSNSFHWNANSFNECCIISRIIACFMGSLEYRAGESLWCLDGLEAVAIRSIDHKAFGVYFLHGIDHLKGRNDRLSAVVQFAKYPLCKLGRR